MLSRCFSIGLVLFAWFVFSFCTGPGLRNPEARPRIDLRGLWLDEQTSESKEERILLHVRPKQAGAGEYDFSFTKYTWVNRPFSGKHLMFNRRAGRIHTSTGEALLIQERFETGERRNSEPAEKHLWPADGYSVEIVERRIDSESPWIRLELSDDGHTLEDGDFRFHRLNAAVDPKLMETHPDGVFAAEIGVVLFRGAAPGLDEFSCITVERSGFAQGRVVEVWRGGERVGRAKIAVEKDGFCDARIAEGGVSTGDALFPVGWDVIAKKYKKAPMTREEVLRRMERGEYVPREEIIKAMRDK